MAAQTTFLDPVLEPGWIQVQNKHSTTVLTLGLALKTLRTVV